MKSKLNLVLLLFLGLFMAYGCSKPEETIEFEMYKGTPLHIGIIGEQPKIREDHIQFTRIEFSDLKNVENYDAIFITKENLKEADKSQYTAVYNNSPRPFLFIETPKSHVPYTRENIEFEDYPDAVSNAYAYLFDGKSQRYWGFGLYNDEVNEKNIEEAYSRIFTTIEEISILN